MNQQDNRTKVRPFVLGVVMTDEWPASPNMGETAGEGAGKTAKMKVIKTAEGWRTILSGQAVGSWHRQTLYNRFGWKVSELQETISGRDTRSFYTQCQPIEYAEDDGRGYMAAATLEEKIKAQEKSGKTKEETWKHQFTTKRTSPFMLSQFQSVAPNQRIREFGILARNLDELPDEVKGGLIFQTEVAAAAYAGLFALNLSELGSFTVGQGRDLLPFKHPDLQELLTSDALPYKAILEKRARGEELSNNEREKLKSLVKLLKRCVSAERGEVLCLDPKDRQQRAHDLIAAMADLEGGAHMTRRLYNVAPASALVSLMNGGNCLPPHIFRATVRDEDEYGNKTYKFEVDVPRLWRVLKDNEQRFLQREGDENFYNVFFGTLGAPTIENQDAVKNLLEGKDTEFKLPSTVRCKICDGPREAIYEAAKSIPLEWFDAPQNAKQIDETVRYGEQLLELLYTEK
jgi:CRISPR-associated protein Cas7/Cst2/DevR subtype I-B